MIAISRDFAVSTSGFSSSDGHSARIADSIINSGVLHLHAKTVRSGHYFTAPIRQECMHNLIGIVAKLDN